MCERGGCSRRHGRGAYVLNSNESQISDSNQRENQRGSSPPPLASAHNDGDLWNDTMMATGDWWKDTMMATQ